MSDRNTIFEAIQLFDTQALNTISDENKIAYL